MVGNLLLFGNRIMWGPGLFFSPTEFISVRKTLREKGNSLSSCVIS